MRVRDLVPWGRNNGNPVPSVLRGEDRDRLRSSQIVILNCV
jgi:hypothetical protein